MGCAASTSQKDAAAVDTPNEKPGRHPDSQRNGKDARSADKRQNGATATDSKGAGLAKDGTAQPLLAGYEKQWPGGKICVAGDSVFTAFSHIGEKSGLTFAAYNFKTTETYFSELTDHELEDVKSSANKGLEWPTFLKMLSYAFSKGNMTLNKDVLEIKLRRSEGRSNHARDARDKETLMCKVPLQLGTGPKAALIAKYFIKPYPKLRAQRAETKDSGKGLRESEYLKKEAEVAPAESILEAGDEAERMLAGGMPALREAANKARRSVGKQEGKMAKMRQELDRLNGIVPAHPLDNMYDTVAPPEREVVPVDVGKLTWTTDCWDENLSLTDVAVSLFRHHGLIDKFKMNKETLVNFWSVCEKLGTESNNAFHSSRQATQMLCCMHFLLEKLKASIQLSSIDVFASLFSAGIYNVAHQGVDDNFIKRAQGPLSMLYSDLYANSQNNCTAAFELMENKHTNILNTMTPKEAVEITEIVRECVVIKSNAPMATQSARIAEFAALCSSGETDWTNSDNVRVALTHALLLCHWSAYAQPGELQKKWVSALCEEFYNQGDRELALGISSSHFPGSNWSTDASRHDDYYATGQLVIIDRIISPLATHFARICPDLQQLVEYMNANKEVYQKEDSAKAISTLQYMGRIFRDTGDTVITARPGPNGITLWLTAVNGAGQGFSAKFEDATLAKKGSNLQAVVRVLDGSPPGSIVVEAAGPDALALKVCGVTLELPASSADVPAMLLREIVSSTELRQLDKTRVDKKISEIKARAASSGNRAMALEGEERALKGCIDFCNAKVEAGKAALEAIEQEVHTKGGDLTKKLEIEDALAIKVRNPLKSPLPPGVLGPPDCKDVDHELLKLVKSRYFSAGGGAEKRLTEADRHCNVIQPYLTSEFCKVTKSISSDKRQQIYDLVNRLDEWDFDVFELQTSMSGGISGEYLREQPQGGALFITMYALCFKWGFMQKFNINEQTLINWLSIVEAGYHPNPYHNSMHAADVLHVTNYIMGRGGCKAKIKATDEEVFAALFAAAIHDYNHPGINNAFHVRSQNYLAVLFNDRSVNENIHASSVFELMRMDEFNILAAFDAPSRARMREDIIEFVLGTDMGLHSMFVVRFKKRLETVSMDQTKADRNLAIIMAVKMADISNCGRPKKLYHGWCNVIVDEFFQQGDRERLQGMPVSPFMDRYTTVMSKGQIGFMSYIVMPLFECMGEFLEHMQMATSIVDENKSYWQEHEDW
ncbi:putative 3prime [Diplonema papillatum]|nr:putative 3prime [Diplonema papillatum]